MKTQTDLREQLRSIDHKSYPLYKSLQGSYQFPKYTLSIDHVQGDPFAAPSQVRVTVDRKEAGFPEFTCKDDLTRTALADELLRTFGEEIRKYTYKAKGSGKSGQISVTSCGQEVLKRTACEVGEREIVARFSVGFPANGRTIHARELEKILFEYLPGMRGACLLLQKLKAGKDKKRDRARQRSAGGEGLAEGARLCGICRRWSDPAEGEWHLTETDEAGGTFYIPGFHACGAFPAT